MPYIIIYTFILARLIYHLINLLYIFICFKYNCFEVTVLKVDAIDSLFSCSLNKLSIVKCQSILSIVYTLVLQSHAFLLSLIQSSISSHLFISSIYSLFLSLSLSPSLSLADFAHSQLIKTSNINRNCAYEFNNDAINPNPSSNLNQNVNAAAHAEALSRTFKNELEEILVSTHT